MLNQRGLYYQGYQAIALSPQLTIKALLAVVDVR